MAHSDDFERHSLLAASRAKAIVHPRSADRATLIRELTEAVKVRHEALAAREATLFMPGLKVSDIYGATDFEGTLRSNDDRAHCFFKLHILCPHTFTGILLLLAQLLSIKLFGRKRFARRLCDKVFDALASHEARLVADKDEEPPRGWASVAERSDLQSSTRPTKNRSDAQRI